MGKGKQPAKARLVVEASQGEELYLLSGITIPPMRILIVKLSAIGDCLLASPVAQALRQTYPDAHIGWVVHPHCAPVVRGNPNLNQIHILPRKKLFWSLPAVTRELRSANYDIAIDLQGLFKSGLVTRLSGAKRRIGPIEAREGATRFYTERVLRGLSAKEHVVPGYLRLAAAAGATWDVEPEMHMPFGNSERSMVGDLLASYGVVEGDKLIVLNPSAGKAIKQWGPKKFAATGDALASRLGAKILITGAPADRELADSLLAEAKSPMIDLTGKTNLNQLAALFSRVDLFIGGDTGPMHIAQAAGTRVLALFGPTDPTILGPRHPRHRIHTLALSCAPCRHRECPIGHLCLENMAAGEVVELAAQMLAEPT